MFAFPEGTLDNLGTEIVLHWNDGRVQRLSAPFLRACCQCGQCVNLPIRIEPGMFPGLTVTRVDLVGGYALQFRFSDGHYDGAYDFTTLKNLPDDM